MDTKLDVCAELRKDLIRRVAYLRQSAPLPNCVVMLTVGYMSGRGDHRMKEVTNHDQRVRPRARSDN